MKVKDFVTLGNLLSGFVAIVMIIEGSFDWACYMIFIGYIFDVLDGPVARLTKQFDKFGGYFDSIADFITYSIAPSFIIYYAFAHMSPYPEEVAIPVGLVLGALPISFGAIRHARYSVRNMSYPAYWMGLPRPVLSLFIIALLRSGMFVHPWPEVMYWVTGAMVAIFSSLHLSKLPFIAHHGRKFMGMIKFCAIWFFSSVVVAWLVGWLVFDYPDLVFDMMLFDQFIYVFLAWTQIPKEDIRRMKHYFDTGEIIYPLVHKEHFVRPNSIAPYWHDYSDAPRVVATDK